MDLHQRNLHQLYLELHQFQVQVPQQERMRIQLPRPLNSVESLRELECLR